MQSVFLSYILPGSEWSAKSRYTHWTGGWVGPTEETIRIWCFTGLETGWALQRRRFECGASLDWRLGGPYRGDSSNVVPHWTGGWVCPTEETVRMWCLTGLEAGWALQRRRFECGASLDWGLGGPYRGDGSNVVPHWTGG
jgi:hypothetical protein